MFAEVVLQIEKAKLEAIFDGMKEEKGVELDTQLDAAALSEIIDAYKHLIRRETGHDFPQKPEQQLVMARDAVFRSWNNERAKTYRRINHIDDWLGTAVNVEAMVFGNLGNTSGNRGGIHP